MHMYVLLEEISCVYFTCVIIRFDTFFEKYHFEILKVLWLSSVTIYVNVPDLQYKQSSYI